MNKDGEQLKVGSLFSGIGGIELGLERTGGFRTIWNCEIEPYPLAILAERWPQVPNLGDITKVDWRQVERPDILCGGFPCQDISDAGRRAGIGGKKSGLWKCYLEAIRELRPRIVLAENVAALIRRGLETVLIDLAEVGYDVEWDCVPACSVGAPHRRDRLFIVAYANEGFKSKSKIQAGRNSLNYGGIDAEGVGLSTWRWRNTSPSRGTWWQTEPDVGRVVNGVSRGMDSFVWKERIKSLGNAVVPQVAEKVGRLILEATR